MLYEAKMLKLTKFDGEITPVGETREVDEKTAKRWFEHGIANFKKSDLKKLGFDVEEEKPPKSKGAVKDAGEGSGSNSNKK